MPTANPAGITTPADLAKPGVKVIAAGDEVPITKYANQLVANLAKEPGYPADFAAAYAKPTSRRRRTTSRPSSPRSSSARATPAIVYVTDAKASTKVTHDRRPRRRPTSPPPTPASSSRPPRTPAAAKAFLDWFAGPDGQAILSGFGFLPPS